MRRGADMRGEVRGATADVRSEMRRTAAGMRAARRMRSAAGRRRGIRGRGKTEP